MENGTVSGRYLYRLFRACMEVGARQPVLLERLHLRESDLINPLGRFSALLVARLLAGAAEELRDPAAAFAVGGVFQPQSFSDIGYSHLYLETLPEVLMRSMEIQYLNQTFMRVTLMPQGDHVELTMNYLGDDEPVYWQFTEMQIASYRAIGLRLLGRPLRILSAQFGYPAPPYAAAYADHYPFPYAFGADKTRLLLSREDLEARLDSANPAIAARYDAFIAPKSSALLAGGWLGPICYLHCMSEMDKSPATLPRLARALGMSERTIRRRLAEEGTSFRDIVEEVRRDLCALYLMEGRHSVGSLALRLGYSDTSAFSRAFARWYGYPPSKAGLSGAEMDGACPDGG